MSDNTLATTKFPSSDDTQKAKENYDRYLYARQRGHLKFIEKHDRCEAFVFDEQWTEDEINFLKKAKRPHLTINKIKPAVLAVLDDYIKNRADIKFVPAKDGDQQTATAISKLYTHIHNAESLSSKELDLVLDGMIGGRAYYLVRIGFDDNFQGEVRISVPNPKNVIPDPDSDSKDPKDWNEFIYESWQSLQEIEFNYGKDKRKQVEAFGDAAESHDIDNRQDDTFAGEHTAFTHTVDGLGDKNLQRVYQVIERQYRRLEEVPHFRNVKTGDLRRIPPHWDSEDIEGVLAANEDIEQAKIQAEVIRWTVSCNGVLLHDSLSPYRSLSIIPYFPFFRRGRTAGAVESLIDPQRNYNKLRSSELHIVSGTSNSGWKVKDGALQNMDPEDLEAKGAQTGLVLVFKDSPDDIERINPVQIPQGMDRISSKADSDLREISGIPDEAKALSAPYASGSRIEAQNRTSLINTTLFFENLNETRKLLAKKVLELVQAFYTEERRINIIGRGLRPEVETLELNTPDPETGDVLNDLTVGEYDVVVTPAPARDSHDQEQFEMLARMQQDLGVPIPSHLFVEFSTLDRKEEIAEEIRKASGTDTPSEEERQLQIQQQQLEQLEKRASIRARMAQAKLSEARANKVLDEIQRADQMDAEKLEELTLKARDLDIRQFETENSIDIRRKAQITDQLKAIMQDDRETQKMLLEQLDRQGNQGANDGD